MIVVTLSAMTAHADVPETTRSDPENPALRARLEQARLFVKKGWLEDARKELEALVASPEGRGEPRIWLLLAEVRFELCDAPAAREAAATAHTLSFLETDLLASGALADFLGQQFGLVEIDGYQSGIGARIRLTPDTPLYDPALVAYVDRLKKRLEKPTELLITLALPVGDWHLNGIAVRVTPVGTAAVRLRTVAATGHALGLTELVEVGVGLGMSTWFGSAAEDVLPALSVGLNAGFPLGPLFVSGTLDLEPRSYATGLGQVQGPATGNTVGMKLGFTLPSRSAVVLRSSVGFRTGALPGIRRGCVAAAVCENEGAHTLGAAQIGFGEFSAVDYRSGRNKGLGLGVSLGVEHAFGRFVETAPAGYSPEGTWSATGARLRFHAVYAL